MLDLLRPGLEPMSPALAGGFLTTVPPGKSLTNSLNFLSFYFIYSAQLICISLMTKKFEHLFMFISNLDILFGEVPDKVTVPICLFGCFSPASYYL